MAKTITMRMHCGAVTMADKNRPQPSNSREKVYRTPKPKKVKKDDGEVSSGGYDAPFFSSSEYDDQCYLRESGFVTEEYVE